MAKPDDAELLTLDTPSGPQDVRVSNPAKLYFTREVQLTKLDLVRYYLAVGPGALQGIQDRPFVLKRFVNGADAEPFYQKRAPDPKSRPAWLRTATLSFPSGRTAEEVVVDSPAALAWVVNLGCIELHPHPVRTSDLDHPDELRIDLDPGPGVPWDDVRRVALEVRAVLEEAGLQGWPKTSGSRGIHVNVRIHPRWTFTQVRRAALALARAVERRAPTLATSKWWKEERHGVFLDYNQNAKDRTTCSAYSVRPLPDARVSTPLAWDEVAACNPADFTVLTLPARFATLGNPHAAMDDDPGSLDALLDLANRDEADGLGDAPWPPHFAKGESEAPRVAPSRAKKPKPFADQLEEGFGAKRFRRVPQVSTLRPGFEPGATGPGAPGLDSETWVPATEVQPQPPEPGAPGLDSETWVPATEVQPQPPEPGAPGLASETWVPATESALQPPTPTRKPPTKRTPKFPLITIAQSPDKAAAEAGLARWRTAHPEAATLLAPDDILIDRMRGSAYVWYRIRVNLRHVPEPDRPAQATPDPDDNPTRAWREPTMSTREPPVPVDK